mgnify:CR=1 FL=1
MDAPFSPHSEHLQLTWQRRRSGLGIQPDMAEDPVGDEGVVEEGHDPAFA